MGHATRSHVILSHLISSHDIRIVTSDRAYVFLKKHYGDRVRQIQGFHLAYKHGKVSKLSSINKILSDGPASLRENFHKYRLLQNEFSPDIVISDFESFSFFYAKHHNLPLISIDNMQVMDRCRLDIPIPAAERDNYLIAKTIVKAKVPRCQHYLISSFFDAPVIKANTTIVPPIIREEILKAKPFSGSHILVYQTSASQNDLIPALQQISGNKFLVYGFNKEQQFDNVQLKTFSESGFIKDLAGARAVLSNGGYSLISECVYLKKPVCSVPIHNQFEQYMNAAYIQKMGYGRHFDSFKPDYIKAFLYDLTRFTHNLSALDQEGNKVLFSVLDGLIEEYT